MNNNKILIKIRHLFKNLTPLEKDCGKTCGCKCCREIDLGNSRFGMWLFPYEEELYKENENFEILEGDGNAGYKFISCRYISDSNSVKCDRGMRPLFCRFFPFFPLVSIENKKYKIKIIPHPSALMLCPLLDTKRYNFKFTSKFYRSIRKAAYIMLNDEYLRKYLIDSGRYLSSMLEFAEKFWTK